MSLQDLRPRNGPGGVPRRPLVQPHLPHVGHQGLPEPGAWAERGDASYRGRWGARHTGRGTGFCEHRAGSQGTAVSGRGPAPPQAGEALERRAHCGSWVGAFPKPAPLWGSPHLKGQGVLSWSQFLLCPGEADTLSEGHSVLVPHSRRSLLPLAVSQASSSFAGSAAAGPHGGAEHPASVLSCR